MTRPDCSYWVTITGDQKAINNICSQIETWQKDCDHIASYLSVTSIPGGLQLEITNGTLEETDEVCTMCETLAKNNPSVQILYSERNEEPFSPDRDVNFASGQKQSEAYGRRLLPRQIDDYTRERCISILSQSDSIENALKTIREML